MPTKTTDKNLQREIGRRIRAARVDAGLTQEEAAAAAGIDWRRWQRLENGTVNPTARTLARVSAALGLTFWALLASPAGPMPSEPAAPARKTTKRAK